MYVGDSDVDMQTANAAGMFAVGAAWGFRPKEELLSNGADAIAEEPLNLIDFLQ
jgi:phosphoglycolate phosphatase